MPEFSLLDFFFYQAISLVLREQLEKKEKEKEKKKSIKEEEM